ncbi:MAG: putative sulfate/molybdate transporter [Solirubrobacterales bacterium]
MSEPAARARRPRIDRHEIAGGLGDAGLLIPLAVAMITLNGINATAAFVIVGLAYAGTALYFRVPVPVQPLKAFAAAAIALGLGPETIAAGAILMALAMGALALTGLAAWLADRFPLVLVRGIQASVALLLAKAAIELAARGNWEGLPAISGAASFAIAVTACALLLAARRTHRFPGALIVLGAGVAVGLAVGGLPSGIELGPQAPAVSMPDAGAFATALTALVIAQLPLTFGNSVVATADAERTYFGARASRVTPNRLAASIGGWNLAAGLAGGLPLCHGAGGVTAHYKLGARTAAATLSAGLVFCVLGLALGGSLPALLHLLAPGALAGMLLFVAIQHGLLASRLERRSDRVLAAGVGVVTLASGNLAIGFAAGLAVLGARAAWEASYASPVPRGR